MLTSERGDEASSISAQETDRATRFGSTATSSSTGSTGGGGCHGFGWSVRIRVLSALERTDLTVKFPAVIAAAGRGAVPKREPIGQIRREELRGVLCCQICQLIRPSTSLRRRAGRPPAHTFSDKFDMACLPMLQCQRRGAFFALLERPPHQSH